MWRSKLALAMLDPFKMHIHIHIHSLKYMEARVVLVMALRAGMEAHARARWRARSGIGTRRLCHTGLGLRFWVRTRGPAGLARLAKYMRHHQIPARVAANAGSPHASSTPCSPTLG